MKQNPIVLELRRQAGNLSCEVALLNAYLRDLGGSLPHLEQEHLAAILDQLVCRLSHMRGILCAPHSTNNKKPPE